MMGRLASFWEMLLDLLFLNVCFPSSLYKKRERNKIVEGEIERECGGGGMSKERRVPLSFRTCANHFGSNFNGNLNFSSYCPSVKGDSDRDSERKAMMIVK